jgi:hypothetical protein
MLEHLLHDIIVLMPWLVVLALVLAAIFGGRRLRISALLVLVIGLLTLVVGYVTFRSPEGRRIDRIEWSGLMVSGNASEGDGISLIRDKGDEVLRAVYDDLKALPNLTFVFIKSKRVTDDGVCLLATLPEVEMMILDSVMISRHGLECVSQMPRLRHLHLLRIGCRGDDLAVLSASKSLEGLAINYSAFRDEEMAYIASIKTLRVVNLFYTDVSQKGIVGLKEMRPDLEIGCFPGDEAGKGAPITAPD